jgi:hypothetical protein
MKKKTLAFCALFLTCYTQAQVTLNVQLPPSGLVQKDQLWNLVLINNSNDLIKGNASLVVQDPVSNQVILSGTSGTVLLSKGLKILSAQDIQPIQYTMIAGNLSTFLPAGSYLACYKFFKDGAKGSELIAEECVRVNINPLSPPLLNLPSDKSELQTAYPQFSWLPPTPAEMFSNLSYNLTVAELLPGQSAGEAIQKNIPVYTSNRLKVNFDNYSTSFTKLEVGKTYVWRVEAVANDQYTVSTEVWSFTIKNPEDKIEPANASFILLEHNKINSGINYLTERQLYVKHYSFDKEHESTIRFLSMDGQVINEQKEKIVYGDNYFRFKLNNNFKQNEVYKIVITDHQNKEYSALFSIK